MSTIEWVAMDPYPRTAASDTRLHPFWSALAEGRFTTTQCDDCNQAAWPPRVVCPNCLSDSLSFIELPRTGTVVGTVLQPVGLPSGFEAPALFALVDVGPVRVFTRIVEGDLEAVQVGDEVEATTIELPPAPGAKEPVPRHLPAFRPMQAAQP